MIEKNRGGRPRKYSDAQVVDAIERVEARGAVPTGAAVKGVMHADLGVSPGIDVGILDAEVQRICHERATEKAKKLAAKLPKSAKDASSTVGDDVTRAVTAVLAQQFDQLIKESRNREAELEADLRIIPPALSGFGSADHREGRVLCRAGGGNP